LRKGSSFRINTFTTTSCTGNFTTRLISPTAPCNSIGDYGYTAGYMAFSCGVPGPNSPTARPTLYPTMYMGQVYKQATSFALQGVYKQSSNCQVTPGGEEYHAVGLNTCYNYLITSQYSYVEGSVIYKSVSSSKKNYLNYTKTVYTSALSCTGPSTVSYVSSSMICQPYATGYPYNTSVTYSTTSSVNVTSVPIYQV